TRHPLRHDQRPLYLRRGFWQAGRHYRQAARARWVRLRSESENRQVAADGLLRQVKPEDLEQFGLIPEIIGRLPVNSLGEQNRLSLPCRSRKSPAYHSTWSRTTMIFSGTRVLSNTYMTPVVTTLG